MLKHKFSALFLTITAAVIVSMAACGKEPETAVAEMPAWVAAESEQSTQDNRYETEAATETEAIIPFSASSAEASSTNTEDAPIPFQYLYRGFSPVPLGSYEEMEAFSNIGTKIITAEEDWSVYMGKYCPGIPYNISVDFSQDCLIASVVSGARPTYIGSNTIHKIYLEEGALLMECNNNPNSAVYVLNDDKTAHFYVEIVVVSRGDVLPEAASYIFHP